MEPVLLILTKKPTSTTIKLWSLMDDRKLQEDYQDQQQQQQQQRTKNCDRNIDHKWVVQSQDDILKKLEIQHEQGRREKITTKTTIVIDLWILMAITEPQWNELCNTLHTVTASSTTKVTSLVITRSRLGNGQSFFNELPHLLVPSDKEDRALETLLRHIGRSLQYLVLDQTQHDCHTLYNLSTLCPYLRGLTISSVADDNDTGFPFFDGINGGAVDTSALLLTPTRTRWKAIAESIQGFHQLQQISIHNATFQKEEQDLTEKVPFQDDPRSWIPLIEAIQRISTLRSYEFKDCYVSGRVSSSNTIPSDCRSLDPFVLTSTEKHRCNFFPRLNLAGYQKLTCLTPNDHNATLSEWVEAMIIVRDRLDCIHYLICSMDPSLLASAACQNQED